MSKPPCSRCGGPQTETHNCIEFLKVSLQRLTQRQKELRARADGTEQRARQWEEQYQETVRKLAVACGEKRTLEEKTLEERKAFKDRIDSLSKWQNQALKDLEHARSWAVALAIALVFCLLLSAAIR